MDEPWRLEEYFELALLRTSGGGSATPPPPGTEEELATFPFNWSVSGSGVNLWFEMPADVPGVTNIFMRDGTSEHTASVVLEPGQRQQVQWPSVTIDGEVDEVALRDAENNIVARGERDETLPDPGP